MFPLSLSQSAIYTGSSVQIPCCYDDFRNAELPPAGQAVAILIVTFPGSAQQRQVEQNFGV